MSSQTNQIPPETRIAPLANTELLLAAILRAFPQSLAVYAYGSRISGNADANSDLDLALLVTGYAEPLQLWDLSGELADIAGCPVDLLDMRAASTVMQFQILQTGRCLWANQPQAGLFECFILSEKTALDAARAGLLNDIQSRGSIYGG